jgi:hypothetical protein
MPALRATCDPWWVAKAQGMSRTLLTRSRIRRVKCDLKEGKTQCSNCIRRNFKSVKPIQTRSHVRRAADVSAALAPVSSLHAGLDEERTWTKSSEPWLFGLSRRSTHPQADIRRGRFQPDLHTIRVDADCVRRRPMRHTRRRRYPRACLHLCEPRTGSGPL